MASYKSHFNPSRRVEDRAPATRLPQRSITPTATPTITSQLAPPSQSKLQKKKPARDERPHAGRAVTSQKVSGRTARSHQESTARSTSSSRLPKPEAPGNTRTPSLVSGSSTSTVESPRPNVLRRKQTKIGTTSDSQSPRVREDSMSSQEDRQPVEGIPGGYKDPFSETVLGISIPPSSTILARAESQVEVADIGRYDYEIGPTDILPIPTPQYALSTTPSTRYSESPGPFSISSTPTSMSSYSPGVVLSNKTSTRTRQASPLQSRPPITRHRTPEETNARQHHALSSVRESSRSSSSTSTVLVEGVRARDRQLQERLAAPPPSPPPHPSLTQRNGRIEPPPEFAHLADHQPTSPPELRRPTRPSRDGTPEIVGLRGPSPIIQSNMATFPTTHRRTTSSESKTGPPPTSRSRIGVPAKPSSRNPSPNPNLGSAFPPTSRALPRGPTPDLQNDLGKRRSSTAPSPVPASGPSPSKTSRFGFFSRRTKTEPVPSTKSEKSHRRGPAAGTGHEGYGRYAFRGRSGSSGSVQSIGRSASAGTTTESLDNTPSSRKSSVTSTGSTDVDDYFLNRLTPVVIRGTGSSTELTRSPDPMHSSSSLDVSSRPGAELKKTTSNTSQSGMPKHRPILLPSAMSDPVRAGSPAKKMPVKTRRPSESEDDMKKSFIPALASRRASRASKLVQDATAVKEMSRSTAKGRKDSLGDHISDGKESRWLKSSKKEKKEKAEKEATKPAKRWNFFQRAHATPRVEAVDAEPVNTSTAASNRVPTSRSVAHYALMGSPSGIDMDDIEQLMQEADSSPEEGTTETTAAAKTSAPVDNTSEWKERERMQSMLLPPKPVLPAFASQDRPASPKVMLRPELQPESQSHSHSHSHSPSPSQSQPARRQPNLNLTVNTRLQSPEPAPLTGQPDLTPVTDLSLSPASSPVLSPIPPVQVQDIQPAPGLPLPAVPVASPSSSSTPRPSRLAQVGRIPQVVSSRNQPRRPSSQSFSRPFVTDQPRPHALPRTSFDSIGSVPATAGAIEPYPVLQGLNALAHGSAVATMNPTAEGSQRYSEFFKFPPRKDSEVSYSSSSGVWSFPPVNGTAVIPSPGAPQSEDEVWNEYDDLIDEVLSPASSRNVDTDKTPRKHPSLEPLPLKTKTSRASSQSRGSATGASNPSLHLRRSRLLAVLHSAQSPTSTVSLSEFLQDYGERNLSVVDPVTGRLSFPSTTRMSTGSVTRKRASSTRSSLPASLSLSARQSKATLASDKDRESASTNKLTDARMMEMAETQADGLASMANLRFGALMTSKWLSFGRVLFSPAHFELKDPSEDRVLVIDGLGKDWSYYCALTYPEATVYNLGPGLSSSAASNNPTEPWSTLRNHHHIGHASLASAFPFPKGFFACVVLRFPPALPSSVHRSIVTECKRVLRPGGHFEISVLDVDLVNMGNRARRAVRGLKVKLSVADEQISLRNISDEIMAGLGRKGFTECNRCFVGVPVAGKLPSPDDTESPTKSRKGSTASSLNKVPQPPKQPKPEVSFSDLLNTQSSESTDDGITDMVARVGRWWYSRCYESLVLPEAGEAGAATSGSLLESSIWRDESLIKECEKRGTSFRLLIAYAQKPEVGVRRTVSV